MKSVVITSTHPETDFSRYDNVIMFIDDYTNLTPQMVQRASAIHGTQTTPA
jgi:hypothetical protein